MAVDTIPSRLINQAKVRPDAHAYFYKQGGAWKGATWGEYVDQVRTAARAMMALGLDIGGTVAILGFNRPEWAIFDLACMCAGGAPAGIYTTCSPPEVQYIIDHAEAPIVLLEDKGQWDKVNAERDNLPKLKHVVMMRGAETIDDPLVMSWEDFNAKAADIPESHLDDRINALTDDQLATFIYTSGTTGPPKGVMLSHKNLSFTASLSVQIVDANPDDVSLSYLPLSHIAEQMFTLHVPITTGAVVYFAESIAAVPDNLKEVQPTVFFAVPRIWEKFHAKISDGLSQASGYKAKMAAFARAAGTEASRKRNRGEPVGGWKYALANKLIFSKLKPKIGLGRARVCVSGAAPISREILEFFASLDITVHEVYGQSEGSGPTSFNAPGKTKLGTVGPPMPGVEVKIAEDGEILAKGPNIFLGYYKDEAATNEALIDGWLHSGDLGEFDSEGFLNITGRKKDIIITAGGKNIAPKNIEAALKNLPLINEAVVIGDRRKYLTALITLDPEASEPIAKAKGVDPADLHKDAALIAEIQAGVDEINKLFARVETIKKFRILHRQLTIEDGELTPTLKVKRSKVNDHFADTIEAMYAE